MDRTNLERVNNDHADTLEERGFRVYRGWNQDVASQLVRLSLQAHILKFTPGDAKRRFTNPSIANIWHNQGRRSIYTLQTDEITGLVWYDLRPREDLEADYTFAIRMYEASLGKKLSEGFMRAAHHDFASRKAKSPDVWLDVAPDNGAARHLYETFGYEYKGIDEGRLEMVYRSER